MAQKPRAARDILIYNYSIFLFFSHENFCTNILLISFVFRDNIAKYINIPRSFQVF